ncbi:LysR family transcriptional regulator [Exilibacterium tricleocarpae]|uniref:LysR family transcriptional regulator n=1 Tax=Exilibacterium tricleocarpae TaxID=2591008 RepID=A0A545T679_9GAMM|nr:LysR family transcriptional regulator [Exilibacterium tricleocarpae]TQV72724.1 LysR family transcriptional regulator [Exilibacterium tricleocarpae]
MGIVDIGVVDLSLRHLKAALYVSQYNNATRAANHLNRSQTAITKAINDLEQKLGVSLFDRSSLGMIPTVYGEALTRRVRLAEAEFAAAGRAHRSFCPSRREGHNISIFSMEISYKRLAALIALYETKDTSAAAKQLNITRTAIYNTVKQLEDLLELPLFERQPNGMTSTRFCSILARHVKLAFAQIRYAIEDIANLNGITRGSVVIGTLPYTRTLLTPRAINNMLKDNRELDISTREGPYNLLEASLRSGDLDFIVGALREKVSTPELIMENLFEDRLAIIARKDHPLFKWRNIPLPELEHLTWVLPPRQTPSRALFEELLNKNGVKSPEHYVESSSLSTIRGLLLESDRVALLSEHQIYYEKKHGMLDVLPIDLEETYRPIGVTMRAHTQPSPAAQLFLSHLRNVAQQMALR